MLEHERDKLVLKRETHLRGKTPLTTSHAMYHILLTISWMMLLYVCGKNKSISYFSFWLFDMIQVLTCLWC